MALVGGGLGAAAEDLPTYSLGLPRPAVIRDTTN